MSRLSFVLAGAAIGNGNRGVEALGRSVADAVDRRMTGSRLTILDDGWGVRRDVSSRYHHADVDFAGVRLSRRWYRPESWAQIRLAQTLGAFANPVARRIAQADAVLDISAGDSFTDLYGAARLDSVAAPKLAALRAARPLVLLPQTYGPFTTAHGRRLAERLVRSAAVAYARDPWSYEQLNELAGTEADTERLRQGVDVAFALEPRQPPVAIVEHLDKLRHRILAGVNVSGLLSMPGAARQFGLSGDYLATMCALVQQLIDAGAHVVFVSHVHLPGGSGESDKAAIHLVRSMLTENEASQTSMLPPDLDAAQLKWCIGAMDWFVGSRMHATIAALSSLVPVYGYAYSDKTRGVFESCGMVDQVADARELAGATAVEEMMASFGRRQELSDRLRRSMPPVVQRSRDQMQELFGDVNRWQRNGSAAGTVG
ncbi:MAG TPA: polysaccharide pyruvyl transferase family protein [Ruania sp.]|nr:polysaccharide pyruvyl transferase family protein [Ruania sp.]